MVKKQEQTQQQGAILAAQLRSLGFSDEPEKAPRRLIVSIEGREKTGKTHLALTAPAPIIFFDIDLGTEGVLGKFQAAGKQVFVYRVRVPKSETGKDIYEALWSDLKARVKSIYQFGHGTVIFDTATEAYELARLAHFGKLTQVMPHHYQIVNNEWRDFMRYSYDSDMSTVYIHKVKPKYVNNTRTGEYEAAGMTEIGYLVQANLVTSRQNGGAGEEPVFSMQVRDCRPTPALCGTLLSGPLCNFEMLLSLVHDKE